MEKVNPLEILREAMQLEKDAVRFYDKAAKYSKDKRVGELFRRLSSEELVHLEKLELVYDHLVENNEWLVMKDLMESPSKEMDISDIFEVETDLGEVDELTAVDMGIRAEENSIKLYERTSKDCDADHKSGCAIFDWLADFEKEHLKLLEDMRSKLVASN